MHCIIFFFGKISETIHIKIIYHPSFLFLICTLHLTPSKLMKRNKQIPTSFRHPLSFVQTIIKCMTHFWFAAGYKISASILYHTIWMLLCFLQNHLPSNNMYSDLCCMYWPLNVQANQMFFSSMRLKKLMVFLLFVYIKLTSI